MAKFIDAHPMGKLSAEILHKLQHAPKDEFGVVHSDILYNKEEDKLYCVLEAPDEEAVRKHHAAAGIEIDWLQKVESTRN